VPHVFDIPWRRIYLADGSNKEIHALLRVRSNPHEFRRRRILTEKSKSVILCYLNGGEETAENRTQP
jgi:hypothetical protein